MVTSSTVMPGPMSSGTTTTSVPAGRMCRASFALATAAFRCAPEKLLDALRDDAITLGEDNGTKRSASVHRELLEANTASCSPMSVNG